MGGRIITDGNRRLQEEQEKRQEKKVMEASRRRNMINRKSENSKCSSRAGRGLGMWSRSPAM